MLPDKHTHTCTHALMHARTHTYTCTHTHTKQFPNELILIFVMTELFFIWQVMRTQHRQGAYLKKDVESGAEGGRHDATGKVALTRKLRADPVREHDTKTRSVLSNGVLNTEHEEQQEWFVQLRTHHVLVAMASLWLLLLLLLLLHCL